MARGNEAKNWVTQKIIECFGQESTILSDKKIYINTTENGEPIQVCLAMTCPKTMVGAAAAEAVATAKAGVDFGAFGATPSVAPEPYKPAEITPQERQTVQDLMKALGL
jgi:hypothetical protein